MSAQQPALMALHDLNTSTHTANNAAYCHLYLHISRGAWALSTAARTGAVYERQAAIYSPGLNFQV
jgi:hypothetical protein